MFPKGILYDPENTDFRTPEINEVVFAMTEIARDIERKDKGNLIDFNIKSPLVSGKGLEPSRLAAYAPQTYLYTNSNIRTKT